LARLRAKAVKSQAEQLKNVNANLTTFGY